MARPGENDEGTRDAVGQVGEIFSRFLRALFSAVAAPAEKSVFPLFNGAAQKSQPASEAPSNKSSFNFSASPTPERQRLLNHLPSREQFSAMRAFYAVNRANRLIGQGIGGASRAAQQNLVPGAKPVSSTANMSPQL